MTYNIKYTACDAKFLFFFVFFLIFFIYFFLCIVNYLLSNFITVENDDQWIFMYVKGIICLIHWGIFVRRKIDIKLCEKKLWKIKFRICSIVQNVEWASLILWKFFELLTFYDDRLLIHVITCMVMFKVISMVLILHRGEIVSDFTIRYNQLSVIHTTSICRSAVLNLPLATVVALGKKFLLLTEESPLWLSLVVVLKSRPTKHS